MSESTRITPSIRNAVLMLLPAVFLLPVLSHLLDVDYDVIADNTSNVLRGIVPMVGISLAWGLFISYRAGWWPGIWSRRAPGMPAFFWLVPLFWFAICLARLSVTPWQNFDITYFLVLAVAMVMVGFNEELLFRGILAHGARGTGTWTEAKVMAVSAIGFGLFHLPNALAGQALGPTLFQVAYAAVMGIALYTAMRVSGTIFLPIFMHALWDYATFAGKTGTLAGTPALVVEVGMVASLALCAIALVYVVVKAFRGPRTT